MDEDMILPEGFEIPTDTETEVNENTVDNPNQEVTTEETEVQPTENTETQQEVEATPSNEPFLKIKYNKEEVPLTQDEVIALSQKGMNYDKLQEKYNQVANSREMQFFNQLAQKNGMTVQQLVDYYEQQEFEAQLKEYTEKNIPEDMARELIESRKFREEQQRKAQEDAKAKEHEQSLINQQNEFLDMYPNVDPKDIPQEVWDKVRNGVPLKYAYMEHERTQLQNQLKTMETNIKNKSKSPIKAGLSVNGSTSVEAEDPFIMGFNSI